MLPQAKCHYHRLLQRGEQRVSATLLLGSGQKVVYLVTSWAIIYDPSTKNPMKSRVIANSLVLPL